MPIYEFVCSDCKVKFESFVLSSKHVGEVLCPKCGSSRVKKQFSLFSCGSSSSSRASGNLSSALSTGGGCGGGSRFT